MIRSRKRSKRYLLLNILAIAWVGGAATQAFADVELRLYDGSSEADLKDRIVIRQDGTSLDYEYKKVCTAFNGCKAVQSNTDQDAKLPNISAGDLSELNAAIGKISSEAPLVAVTPAKASLCRYFSHFVYEIKDSRGKTVKTEEITACTGTRLQDANSLIVERILNISATNAGL